MHEEEAVGQVSSVPNFARTLPSSSSRQDEGDYDDEGGIQDSDAESADSEEADDAGGEFHQAEIALRGLVVDDAAMQSEEDEDVLR